MKLYGSTGAVLGFIFGCVTGSFVAWIVIEWLTQYMPAVASSAPAFILLWGLHVLLTTAAFGVAGMLLHRFETFLERERPRHDPF